MTENIATLGTEKPLIHKPALELVSGDVLVGDMGGTTMVIDAAPSSSHPGFVIVTTEFGYLFLDDDEESLVTIQED